MKSVFLLTILLQAVVGRPDVSHLSGSLGPGKGYNYPVPEIPFEVPGKGYSYPVPEIPFEEDSRASESSGGSSSVDEFFSSSFSESQSSENQLDPEPESTGRSYSESSNSLLNEYEEEFISSSFSESLPPTDKPSAESSEGQSAVSTASFIRTDSRLKGEGATYKAGNPGIFHIARLKGHDIPQVFINIFSRDDDEPV